MAAAAFVRNGPLEFVATILSLIALLAWLALSLMFAVSAGGGFTGSAEELARQIPVSRA